MKKELLKEIREEVLNIKKANEERNKRRNRIRELETNESVKEYIKLRGIDTLADFTESTTDERTLASEIYYRYIYRIDKEDTNGIYVYLGTYRESYESDIVHCNGDIKIGYNNPNAEYRLYQDLEQHNVITVPIKDCEEFEKSNKVIFPKGYNLCKRYYEIQKDFFTEAITSSEEEACKLILRKNNAL